MRMHRPNGHKDPRVAGMIGHGTEIYGTTRVETFPKSRSLFEGLLLRGALDLCVVRGEVTQGLAYLVRGICLRRPTWKHTSPQEMSAEPPTRGGTNSEDDCGGFCGDSGAISVALSTSDAGRQFVSMANFQVFRGIGRYGMETASMAVNRRVVGSSPT